MNSAGFENHYRRAARWIAWAPGRVNVIGEHTDYNGGFVMPMAIERRTTIAAAENGEGGPVIRMASATMEGEARIDLSAPNFGGQPEWCKYVAGVFILAAESGWRTPGLDLWIESTVPAGSGLSSSAALEVATATLIEAVTVRSMKPAEKGLLCQKAEHEFAGVPCGIMDQFVSVMARADHLLMLDCRSMEPRWIAFDDPSMVILIANTNVKHALTDGGYARRRQECEQAAAAIGVRELRDATLADLEKARGEMSEVAHRRARHVITENQRVMEVAEALPRRQWDRVAAALYASHQSLRDDYNVSCEELDLMVSLAMRLNPSGGGSRMTGGGFGGCTVNLVPAKRAEQIAAELGRRYRAQTGIEPMIFTTRPAAGAAIG